MAPYPQRSIGRKHTQVNIFQSHHPLAHQLAVHVIPCFSLTPTAIDYREPNISVGPAQAYCSQIISRIIGSTGNKNNSGKRNNSGNKQKFTESAKE